MRISVGHHKMAQSRVRPFKLQLRIDALKSPSIGLLQRLRFVWSLLVFICALTAVVAYMDGWKYVCLFLFFGSYCCCSVYFLCFLNVRAYEVPIVSPPEIAWNCDFMQGKRKEPILILSTYTYIHTHTYLSIQLSLHKYKAIVISTAIYMQKCSIHSHSFRFCTIFTSYQRIFTFGSSPFARPMYACDSSCHFVCQFRYHLTLLLSFLAHYQFVGCWLLATSLLLCAIFTRTSVGGYVAAYFDTHHSLKRAHTHAYTYINFIWAFTGV